MFNRGITFVIIPPRTSRVLRMKVPRSVLVVLVLALVGFGVAGGVAIYRTMALTAELSSFRTYRDEYLRQQVALKKVANKVDAFKEEMSRLRELDYKLRLITDLEVERPRSSLYGVGGFLEDTGEQGLSDKADLSQMDVLTILNKDLGRLEKLARHQEESFNNLKAHLADQKDLIERTPFRWPVRGFISSPFGLRTDPFTGQQRMHPGLDIVAPRGTVVRAPADGIVTFSGVDPSLGNMIVIDHGYGVISRYGHNEKSLVREGQRVKRGDPISMVGSTGRSTGPHLHYEIRVNDVAVNPLKMIIN